MSDNSDAVATVFDELGRLEKEFAQVEVDALRSKEFSLKDLYSKRKTLLEDIVDFWPATFTGIEDVREFITPSDLPLLAALKSFSVDRYQIESESKGEPRSLRFTFEFEENEFFEDTTLVKEFEYQARDDGLGNLVSTPVPIKFKGKKKDVTYGLLDAAVNLHAAEEALKLKKGDTFINLVDRETLWQHEKLREKLLEMEENLGSEGLSFFNWFGFRGAVNINTPKARADKEASGSDDDDTDDEFEEQLEVEIFPPGEEVANILAEDLWPNAMSYFMSAQDEDTIDGNGFDLEAGSDSADDLEAPELIVAADPEALESVASDDMEGPELIPGDDTDEDPDSATEDGDQPRKRQRKD